MMLAHFIPRPYAAPRTTRPLYRSPSLSSAVGSGSDGPASPEPSCTGRTTRGSWMARSRRLDNSVICTPLFSNHNKEASFRETNTTREEDLSTLPSISQEVYPTRSFLWSMKFDFVSGLTWASSFCWIMRTLQMLPSFKLQSSVNTSLPFACVSSSIGKPVPLKLDVSFPSLNDIRWSLSRLYYLFNMQLERNIATFLIALLAACFSFVVVGGLLFYRFRNKKQSLEDCLWEAWACLCSSSTHLRV